MENGLSQEGLAIVRFQVAFDCNAAVVVAAVVAAAGENVVLYPLDNEFFVTVASAHELLMVLDIVGIVWREAAILITTNSPLSIASAIFVRE
jgi:hypothetical protein